MSPNLKAFLDTIAWSEGTSRIPDSNNGYDVIVGGTLFHNGYVDHPRKLVTFKNGTPPSTAAGRYQLLERYWNIYKLQLKLPDFSPASQDAVATRQIRECGALLDADAGRFDQAVTKCAHIWASLPGAGYGQHENSLEQLREFYIKAGGTITAPTQGVME